MKGYIKSENTNDIKDLDIIRIGEIEQDGWAHGIGEYRICNECGHIHSKQDIYGDLPAEIYTHTVKYIENLLRNLPILCKICNGETSNIFGESYLKSIRDRYKNHISFLTTFRDYGGEIQGFIDGYIADFHTIYDNEFSQYYGKIGRETIKKNIQDILGKDIPNLMLVTSGLCIHEKYRSLYIVHKLMKQFYRSIEDIFPNITGIYESNTQTNIHTIHKITGGKAIGVGSMITNDSSTGYKSDIMIHEDILEASREKLGNDLKSFIRINKRPMRKIIEMNKK